MKTPRPRGLNPQLVERLLSDTKGNRLVGNRIEVFSRRFLGRPYKSNPLIGSPDTAEVFSASLEGFDCVTYIESVLALARASNVDAFINWLRKLRYERGRIMWQQRNHYMTFWIRNNVREGVIRPLSISKVPTVARERVLNVVRGLAARRTSVRCVPKSASARLEPHLRSGDLVFFVSTRKNLDVFHAGVVVRERETTFLRHASRSRGSVVQQKLGDFLKSNRMAGVIVVRPREMSASAARRPTQRLHSRT